MKFENSHKALTLILALALLLSGCTKETSLEAAPTAALEIRFIPTMNGRPLALNTPYTNTFGETFTLTIMRFYAGRFALADKRRGEVQAAGGDPYYLPDLANPASLVIRMPIRAGEYGKLSFILGVDSALNVSGVQSGVLDPARGMFWTWNTGYIFTKLEGNSPASGQPNGKFEYHLGGFRSPYSAIMPMEAVLPGTDTWKLENGKTLYLDIGIELSRYFNGSYPLRISEEPAVMTPGETAMKLSMNFAGCLEVLDYRIE